MRALSWPRQVTVGTKGDYDLNLLREQFRSFDVDGSGEIDAVELQAAMTELGEVRACYLTRGALLNHPKHAKWNLVAVKRMSSSCCTLLNNVVDPHACAPSMQVGVTLLEAHNMVDSVDRDGSGTINFDEFIVLMSRGSRRGGPLERAVDAVCARVRGLEAANRRASAAAAGRLAALAPGHGEVLICKGCAQVFKDPRGREVFFWGERGKEGGEARSSDI